jgi:hypothetical protein
MKYRCVICALWSINKLCSKHKKKYIWDSKAQGYRLRKKSSGSRYTNLEFHKNEIKLTKILESYYGASDVVTSFHPLWAVTQRRVLYEFDIYIKSKKLLIEYNGIQHYEFTPFFHKFQRNFIKQQRRDKDKAQLAKDNGFKLIVFKYDEPIFKDYVLNKIEGSNGN